MPSPVTLDRRPPTIMYRGRPILRVMWLHGGAGIEFGDGGYYGWRWWIGIGRLLVLAGRADA